MKFPDLSGTSNMSSEKSHISNNRLYSHDATNSSWTYDIESIIPKHHWKFCDVNDSNDYANDSGSNPIQLEKYGNASLGNSGKISYSAHFDGVGDYFYDSSIPSETYQTITISLWVKINDMYSDSQILVSGGVSSGFFIRLSSNDMYMRWGSSNQASKALPLGLNNTWVHLTYSYDNSIFKYYLNGVLYDSVSVSNNNSISITSMYVGDYYLHGHEVNGYLEDVRIYDRVLNGQEVALIYNQGQGTYQQSIPRGFPTTIRPTNHIKLQDGDESNINDSGVGSSTTAPTEDSSGSGVIGNTGIGNKKSYFNSGSNNLYSPIHICSFASLSFWVKSVSHTTSSYIFKSSVHLLNIKYISSTQIQFIVNTATYNYTLIDNEWYHITVLLQTDSNESKIYINANYKTTLSDTPSVCTKNIYFLTDMTGYVFDIRAYYESHLQPYEISNIYNNGEGTLL